MPGQSGKQKSRDALDFLAQKTWTGYSTSSDSIGLIKGAINASDPLEANRPSINLSGSSTWLSSDIAKDQRTCSVKREREREREREKHRGRERHRERERDRERERETEREREREKAYLTHTQQYEVCFKYLSWLHRNAIKYFISPFNRGQTLLLIMAIQNTPPPPPSPNCTCCSSQRAAVRCPQIASLADVAVGVLGGLLIAVSSPDSVIEDSHMIRLVELLKLTLTLTDDLYVRCCCVVCVCVFIH